MTVLRLCVVLIFSVCICTIGSWFLTHQEYPIHYPETLSDCSWEPQSVDNFNNEKLYPLLKSLCERVFFTYWKVNYWRDCEIWEDDNQECSFEPGSVGGCQICPCDNDEVRN